MAAGRNVKQAAIEWDLAGFGPELADGVKASIESWRRTPFPGGL